MDVVYRRSYRGGLRLAVFDWAGTTVDYGCLAPSLVFVEGFKLRGVDITIEQARGPMGLMKKDHIRAVTQMPEVAARWREVHGREPTEDDVTDMYEKDFKRLQLECIANYSELIPGALDAVETLRSRGMKIGATTGYFGEANDINIAEAAKQGYKPDITCCATDVPAGRPEPWMIYACMQATRTFPPEAVVKIGDTDPDIAAGLNAGVWTIGVSKTGNEVGLSEADLAKLSDEEQARRVARADEKLRKCGAHYVVESIAEVPAVVDEINAQLRAGEKP